MPRHHFTTDAHFEVGDHVLVRGVRACVRMETATQVLVVFDQAQGGQQEEWVQKSSPALKLARNSASLAATAAAAAHGGAGDPDEELSSEGEDDECNICGNGGKLTCCDVCPRVYHLRCLPLADVEALKEMGDEGEWWCPHCRRLSRVTFCTFRLLSESCTPHAPVDVNASAEELYTFMQDEQHADTFDVVRQAGDSLMAAMPHTHPWRYRDAAELHGEAPSFEYEAAEDAALQLQARVTPEWWAGACDPPEPMEVRRAVGRTEHASASARGEGRNDSPGGSAGRSGGGGSGGGSDGGGGGGGGSGSSAAADAASKEEKVPTSQYRGVSRRYGRWKARIKQNGTDIVIGDFDDEMSAALAYDKKSREMHGTKAFVNFPDDPS